MRLVSGQHFLLRIQLGLVVCGGALAWFGFKNARLSGVTKSDPQTITCRALTERGPGDNAHVRLTDFALLEESFVIEQIKGTSQAKVWMRSWVPAIPADHPYVRRAAEAREGEKVQLPTDFRVLVQRSVGSDLGFPGGRPPPQEIHGTVVNEIESIDSDVAQILRQSYPGVDTSRCWILEEGRSPPASSGGWKIAAGIGLMAGAVGWFVLALRLRARSAASTAARERRYRERRQAGGPGGAGGAPRGGDDPPPRSTRRGR